MGIYNKLADDIDEVDIIIAGGTMFLMLNHSLTNFLFHRWDSRMHYSRSTR